MASWTKGKAGDWLVRAEPGLAGRTIDVPKKSGGTSQATLAREIWRGDGVALYAVESREQSRSRGRYRREPSSGRGRWTGCSCGSREDDPRDSDCSSCRFDSE